MFSFRTEGFSCSLGVLYGGLGVSKLQLLIKKISNCSFSLFFFWSSKPWIRTDIQPKMPDPESMKSGSETLLPRHNLGVMIDRGPTAIVQHSAYKGSSLRLKGAA